MTTPTDPITEAAKAAQEIAKSTGKGIEAAREAGGFIAKYIAGPLEQGMGIFEDRLRYARWERQIRLMRRADQFLAQVGLAAPTQAVPLKLAIPLLQAGSIEEDDELQDRWARLLVNAANAGSGVSVHRSYIAILEQLTPLEAQIVDVVYALPFEAIRHEGVWTGGLPMSARPQTQDDKRANAPPVGDGLPESVKVALGNLVRLGCLKLGATWGGGENFGQVNPTVLGSAFVRACRLA